MTAGPRPLLGGSVTVVELRPEKKHAVEIELLNFCPLRDCFRTGWMKWHRHPCL